MNVEIEAGRLFEYRVAWKHYFVIRYLDKKKIKKEKKADLVTREWQRFKENLHKETVFPRKSRKLFVGELIERTITR